MTNSQLLLLKHHLSSPTSGYTTITLKSDLLHSRQVILAQTVRDPKVLEQMQNAWNNFVESGQIWALIIGLFVGYMFRGLTSYN